jgi:hypothetical protein
MMSIPRFISLTILYLLATVFAPMPFCCCGVLGDPYPGTPYEQITEEQWATTGVQDTYSFYFGSIGIVGILFFLSATILLHVGQKQNSDRSVLYRSVGFGLMLFWVSLVILIASISLASIPPDLTGIVGVGDFELKASSLLVGAIKIQTINIAIALPCGIILFRKPRTPRTNDINKQERTA